MKATTKLQILLILLGIQAFYPLCAQEKVFDIMDVMDLPPELNPERKASCSMEFQEKWILDVEGLSISKEVEAFWISCKDSLETASLPGGTIRIKDLSYEFSFLDLMELLDQEARNLQKTLIALINQRSRISEAYNPATQLLSVYFHEEWIVDTERQLITKKIRAITPVIWQERKRADGESIPDGDTGYPVYYKLKLNRIDLRNP